MTARFIPDPDILWWYDGPLGGLCTLDGVTHFYFNVTYLNDGDEPVMHVVLSLLPGEEQTIRAKFAGLPGGGDLRIGSDRIVAWVTETDGEKQVNADPPSHVSQADVKDLEWEFMFAVRRNHA